MLGLATVLGQEQTSIQEVRTLSIFRKQGEMMVESEMAQLIFVIDLKKMDDTLAALARAINNSTAGNKMEKVKRIKRWQRELRSTRNKIARESQRERRGIASWVAGFAGLFNAFQVHQVKGTVENVKTAAGKIVAEVDIIQRHLELDEDNIKVLGDRIRKTTRTLWDLGTVEYLLERWTEATASVHAIKKVLRALSAHELAPEITDLFDVEEEWSKLRRRINEAKKKSAIQDWQHVIQLKPAFWVKGEWVTIAVQIPIIEKESPHFTLYKRQAAPIHISDKFYHVLDEIGHIAVNDRSDTVVTISGKKLRDNCERFQRRWFCQGERVETHGKPSTCVHALWRGNIDEIQEVCHLTATRGRQYVTSLNRTTSLWCVTEPTTITTVCKGQATQKKKINTTSLVTVQPGCRALSETFTFVPAQPPREATELVIRMTQDTEERNISWGLQSWRLQQPKKIIRRGKAIQELLDNAEPPLIPTWVAAIIAIVALVAVVIFIGWLYLLARKQWYSAAPPIQHFEPQPEVHVVNGEVQP